MPQGKAQFEVIPVSQAINKYFEISVYLLVLMGFGTLASTGTLDLPAVILVCAALAFRGYLLTRGRRLVFSQRWTTPLSLVYFVFYAADYFVFSRGFLVATVHLVLFAVVVRTFSLRRDRDYVMLAIVAFLMVLASAVLTVDSIFLAFFAAFMLMAVATFMLMEMRRAGRAAQYHAWHSNDLQEHRHLAFSLARFTPVVSISILMIGGLFFFVLPRGSRNYFGGYSFGTNFSTGFSDRVQLGGIGQIQQSNALVMHIQIDGDPHGQYALYWRGVSLANFDGTTWSNPSQKYVLRRAGSESFAIPGFGQGMYYEPGGQMIQRTQEPARLIHYHVLMEPIDTNVFFLAPWVQRVSGSYRALQVDLGGAVSNFDAQGGVTTYEADSDISQPTAQQLRRSSGKFPPFILNYLQLPAIDSRIPRLSGEVSGYASNEYDKAIAIENYLKSHYGYTLQLPRSRVRDPLANFLFERKEGHCEYFASSMAVMLRALRIPSRVVTGFRSSEFNDLSGYYVVRARDAHAWVEAYFPGYGWITFDPTPGSTVGSPRGWGRATLYFDAAASFWREWVVSYDASHQFALGHSALAGTRENIDRTRLRARLVYFRMLDWSRRSKHRLAEFPGLWLTAGLALGMAMALILNARKIVRFVRSRALQRYPERAPPESASLWYGRMTRLLARHGVERLPSQTAEEFCDSVRDTRLKGPLRRFTSTYESARFGNSSEAAKRLPELLEEVETATK